MANSTTKDSLYEKFSKYFQHPEDVQWDLVDEDEDGDLICLLCGDKLTAKLSPSASKLFGKDRIRVECSCHSMARRLAEKKEEELTAEQNRQYVIKALKAQSGFGKRFENARFEDYKIRNESMSTAVKTCSEWCDKPSDGLYLYGSNGLGKTMLMACMANRIIDARQKSVMFINAKIISEMPYDSLSRATEVDYLFFDDIGSGALERFNESTKLDDFIYYIVDERYRDLKPMVFSSNYTFDELAGRGMRSATVDRIREIASTVVPIKGESYRRIKE